MTLRTAIPPFGPLGEAEMGFISMIVMPLQPKHLHCLCIVIEGYFTADFFTLTGL